MLQCMRCFALQCVALESAVTYDILVRTYSIIQHRVRTSNMPVYVRPFVLCNMLFGFTCCCVDSVMKDHLLMHIYTHSCYVHHTCTSGKWFSFVIHWNFQSQTHTYNESRRVIFNISLDIYLCFAQMLCGGLFSSFTVGIYYIYCVIVWLCWQLDTVAFLRTFDAKYFGNYHLKLFFLFAVFFRLMKAEIREYWEIWSYLLFLKW